MEAVISVLMPVFRPDMAQLRKAVESILEQTFEQFELLVLYEESEGDGDVRGMLEDYGDERILIFTMPEKCGLPASLNIGISHAAGRYIARMDADDISLAGRFEKQYDYLEKHPEISILGGIVKIMGEGTCVFKKCIENQELYRILFLLDGNQGPAHPSVLIRKSFLDRTGLRYDESFHHCEDYKFWIDAMESGGGVYILPETVLLYRRWRRQATVAFKEEISLYTWQIRAGQMKKLGDYSEDEMRGFFCWSDYDSLLPANRARRILKKTLRYNRKEKVYNQKLLKKEFACRWFKKSIRRVRYLRRVDYIFRLYTLAGLLPQNMIYLWRQLKQERRMYSRTI